MSKQPFDINPELAFEALLFFLFRELRKPDCRRTLAELKAVISPEAFNAIAPLVVEAIQRDSNAPPSVEYAHDLPTRVERLETSFKIVSTLLAAFTVSELTNAAKRVKQMLINAPVDSPDYANAVQTLDMLAGVQT